MARTGFTTSNYLSYGAGIVTAVPLTLAAWGYIGSFAASSQSLIDLHNSASSNVRDRFNLGVRNTDGVVQFASSGPSSNNAASTSTTVSTGVWFHAAGVAEADGSSRSVFLNAGGKVSTSSAQTPSGINVTNIGVQSNSGGLSQPFGSSNIIAEAAIWNVALSDTEIAILAAGISPLLVRPASLVAYWPLMGHYSPEINLKSNIAILTMTGSLSQAPHPRIFMPRTALWKRGIPPSGRGHLLSSHRNRLIVPGGLAA